MKHCSRADLMREYFEQSHAGALNEKLQSKLGKYVEVAVDTVADEDGGDIKLSFGIYDLREELVNFSKEVADRINKDKDYEYEDITANEIERAIKQYIDMSSLNIDIDWKEDSKSITLFYGDKDYKVINTEREIDKYNFIVLDELYNSIDEFIEEVMQNAISEFNEAWVYSYSLFEDEEEYLAD